MRIKVRPAVQDILRICEENDEGTHAVDAYLVLGRKKAVLIDACEESESIYEIVRRITSLPLEVLLTHGHPDHAGKGLSAFAGHGIPIWMDAADEAVLQKRGASFAPVKTKPLQDGMVFDLGGMVLEAISLGGHTPGSMVFYEQERHILLSGDAIGSGAFWMQLPESLPLSQFLANARLLQKRTASGNLVILPGHSYQSESVLSDAYLQDVIDVTEDILNGKQSGQLKTMLLGGMMLEFKEAARGQMHNYVYDPKKAY